MGEQPAGGGSTGKSRPTIPASGLGVTATSITLGISVYNQHSIEQVGRALGADIDFGDGRGAAQAIIDYLNAGGGMAGRKVIPVYREYDITQDFATEFQKDCATFTEDNKVFAVASQVFTASWEVLGSCLAKHKTVYVHDPNAVLDQPMYDRWAPYMYTPSLLRGDRWGTIIDELVAAGFFDRGAKIGTVRYETAVAERTLNRVVKPRLAAHGLKITEEAAYTPGDSLAANSNSAAQVQNIVLRFGSQRITHVLFVGTTGNGPFFFLPAAESQGYRPRYAFNSTEQPNFSESNAPKAQLHRALVIGWWPTIDVSWAQDPKDNPAESLCFRIIRRAGVTLSSRNTAWAFAIICDVLFFLRATLDRARALTPQGLRAVVDKLGTSYSSPLTFSTRFGPGRFDGANAVRLAAFDDACGCFKYRGNVRPAT